MLSSFGTTGGCSGMSGSSPSMIEYFFIAGTGFPPFEMCTLYHMPDVPPRGSATELHDRGIDDKTIQGRLRHSDVATTQACYIKSLPHQLVNAAKTLDDDLQDLLFSTDVHSSDEPKSKLQ
jgi:hypothetical protein